MKQTDLKENSSVLFIGRGFIIAAIFITSSLSFTLGYFVGKSVRPPVVNQTPVFSQESAEQKNIEPAGAVLQQPQQTQKIQPPEEIQGEASQIQENNQTKETLTTRKTKEAKKTQITQKIQPRKYTVQAGAFKNVSDANILKERLDKKGYKTYITLSETKYHKKLYKVKIGYFATRKEAEILSVRIKKSEGLNTFVTFKTEQEGLR
jgi:cell division septation protein DedD